MSVTEKIMKRCIMLARRGTGAVAPNPLVGAAVVYKDRIIGEGYHRQFGEAHAEVHALQNVTDKSLLKESTLYVTLEPCTHFGKTPPCTNLILTSGIPHVIIGARDTNSKVNGGGIEKLRAAGIHITEGVLEKECRQLNVRFFTFHEKQRPYIILKWAQTSDGYISRTQPAKKEWISHLYSRTLVHKWRSEEQAILTGTHTTLYDNPKLDVRLWEGKNPVRIVIDRTLSLPANLHVFDHTISTLVFTEKKMSSSLENISYISLPFDSALPVHICKELHCRGIQSVIIEGGKTTLDSFVANNLWDEARIFIAPLLYGEGLRAPFLPQEGSKFQEIPEGDRLMIIKNKNI